MDDNKSEVVETTTSTESAEVVETAEIDTEDVEALKAELAKEREAKKQLTARAKKAEAELKGFKTPKEAEATQNITSNAPTNESIEATVLKAQGMPDELLNELKAIAKVRGKGLIETQSDPLFIALKESKETEEKKRKATLGASKGSGSVKKDKDFKTPGLSREEHKATWREKNGR